MSDTERLVRPEPRHAEPESFHVELRTDRERVLVAPRGELDLATVDELRVEIDALARHGFAAIVVDLRETSFLDSVALHMLIEQCNRPDARVTIIDAPRAARLFDVAEARHLLRFEASL
jgi:anti-anti-sigma factor